MVFDLKTRYEIACMQPEKVPVDKIVSESTRLISTTIKNKDLPLHLSKNIDRNIYIIVGCHSYHDVGDKKFFK